MGLRSKTSIVLSCWSGLGILRPADYLTMFLLSSQPELQWSRGNCAAFSEDSITTIWYILLNKKVQAVSSMSQLRWLKNS